MITLKSALFSQAKWDWRTPKALFTMLDMEFKFTVDAAATGENKCCPTYWGIRGNPLTRTWKDQVVWCNPPYGQTLREWIAKAHYESHHATSVLLVPTRTDKEWWHDYALQASEIRFVRGRLCFNDGRGRAPFPSALLVFRRGR